MIKLRICFLAALVLLLACLTACTVRVCDVCERTVIGKNYADDDFETLCKDCYATQRRMAYYGSENRDSALLEKTESADSEEAFVISQRSFTKPEQAGKFFVESLAKQDLTEALSAFCIRGCAENFDFEAYTDREGTFLPSRLLPEGTAYQPLNELYFLNKAGVSVRSFLCNLLTDYEVSQTYAVNGKELTAPEIIASFDAEQLSTLKCLRIDLSCQSVQSSEAHKANMDPAAHDPECPGAQRR